MGGWKGRPIWKSAHCCTNAFPLFVPFNDRFCVYDGSTITWFDSRGRQRKQAALKLGDMACAAQYEEGLLLVLTSVWEGNRGHDEILAADAWTGKRIRKFVLPARD